ncbi:MAG: hypothetical protein QOI86_5284 [Actinomycetota bacterium]|nr:hypothetical protein [Actinomycetota bacterium]
MVRRIRQLVGEAPTDALRILTFSAGALAVALGGLADHFGFVWLWPVALAAVVPAVVAGTAWTVRNYRAPDRLAIEWSWDNRLWFIGFAFLCAFTVGGLRAMVTDGAQGILLGGSSFFVGVAILVLVIRHFRKPTRPPDPIVRDRYPWDDESPPEGWRQLR